MELGVIHPIPILPDTEPTPGRREICCCNSDLCNGGNLVFPEEPMLTSKAPDWISVEVSTVPSMELLSSVEASTVASTELLTTLRTSTYEDASPEPTLSVIGESSTTEASRMSHLTLNVSMLLAMLFLGFYFCLKYWLLNYIILRSMWLWCIL